MQSLTWDAGILSFLALLTVYTVLIRRHKALATLVSTYVAYFVATAWGPKVAGLFSGQQAVAGSVWIRTNANPFTVQVVMLVAFTFLLSAFMKLGGRRSRYAMGEVVAYAICTVGLLLMFMLLLMEPAQRDATLLSSSISAFVFQWREWVLMLPIVAIIAFGMFADEDN